MLSDEYLDDDPIDTALLFYRLSHHGRIDPGVQAYEEAQ